ncbi:HAD family hydrolase [Uliginosibacterium flavum]|uniref:HAD-IB family hydrolase n=1 Tax=Uliginosibacterium flavum TaxID=1396831 RepID=A0ABV2TKW7_9RHOO
MNLALFDLDNTLLDGDSDHAWGQFLCDKGVVDPVEFKARNDAFYEQYKAGTLQINEFLDFVLAPLASRSREELMILHDEFMNDVAFGMVNEMGKQLVNWHLAQGDLCAIVTATNAFVTERIVRYYFHVPHLIATVPALDNGQFTGKARGTPAFREGKVTRVNAWLESMALDLGCFEKSWFYSDSLNDVPLLEVVSDPVVVDPDAGLRLRAETLGWPIISLRGRDEEGAGEGIILKA